MKVVILGAGIGGKLAAQGINNTYKEHTITLIGPEVPDPEGLFYFNQKIDKIADSPIKVDYKLISDEGSPSKEEIWRLYQKKSRGTYDSSIKISSIDKIGKSYTGYALRSSFDFSDIFWIKNNCTKIDPKSRTIYVEGVGKYQYDRLIVTVPIRIFYQMIYGKTPKLLYTPIYTKTCFYGNPREVSRIVVGYDITQDSPYYRQSVYLDSEGCFIKTIQESIKEFEGYSGKIPFGKITDDQTYCSQIEKEHPEIGIFGRYARWSYHYLVTDTYTDAIKFISNK